MNKRTVLFGLSVSFITAVLTAVFLTFCCSHREFMILDNFCREIVKEIPDTRQVILKILKEQKLYVEVSSENSILNSFGYVPADFFRPGLAVIGVTAAAFVAGSALSVYTFWYWKRRNQTRIEEMRIYLEKINTGRQGILWDTSEDEFSGLQDEIYKTVTALYQTRDDALEAKNNFAENLANIAYQLKTPITAVSLSLQIMREQSVSDNQTCFVRIRQQLDRLVKLEEALLLLSRIDAGTLTLRRRKEDVFTVLTLASDHLQELSVQAGVSIDIPEMGETDIYVDLDWTMEAVMNLMKNCMEASAAGTMVHCSYEETPLYVRIRIWDEGQGFSEEDLPRLFQRFYRGKNAEHSGIGIGLSLAKSIIEMQNGILDASNLPEGGACFEIRFYPSPVTEMSLSFDRMNPVITGKT